MFTGVDVIVVLLVIMGFIYVNAPEAKAQIQFEPLTLLVVIFVVSMIIVSIV